MSPDIAGVRLVDVDAPVREAIIAAVKRPVRCLDKAIFEYRPNFSAVPLRRGDAVHHVFGGAAR